MNEEKILILEYDAPFPEIMKSLMERSLKVTFGGCNIKWINNSKIMVTKMGIKNLKVVKPKTE